MFSRTARRQWICIDCARRQRRLQAPADKRCFGNVAAQPKTDFGAAPVSLSKDAAAKKDDDTIRKLFDSQPFWDEFSKRTSPHSKRTGLLQNKYLTSPQGFQQFSNDALKRCQKLVATVLAASTVDEYKSLVQQLDRLSDQLCRVIDLVDFIRNVHPDPQIQNAAAMAHSHMFEYMNILNTTRGLNDQLTKAASMEDVTSSWTEEEKVTAKILLRDFAQSAIQGPQEERQKFVDLSNEIVTVGNQFIEEMAPQDAYVKIPSNKMHGMDPVAVRRLTKFGTTSIPVYGGYARMALRTVEDPEVRRELYMANNTASKRSVGLVERLLRARADLATVSGHQSFGHMTLSDKMAKTPEAVNTFLEALAASNRPQVNTDMRELLEIKQSDARRKNFPDTVNAWDKDYYSARLKAQLYPINRPPDLLSAYFSVGTVMQGLSRLFNRLYGVRLSPAETRPGETWNDDVRRLDVIDENEGHIAVIYCDLFQRPNKSPNPAHFTLRCSREISSEEIADAQQQGFLAANPSLSELSNALNDGMALNFAPSPRSNGLGQALKQLPTIGFICDFPRPAPGSNSPTLLSFRNVATLFHEMGHCLHSILGRTMLQNVAGTRCATDFAELPSVLMEHFAASPAVLSLYARHWQNDKPLNVELVAEELAMAKKLTASQETEMQILLSVLDQVYHSTGVNQPGWDSSDIYHQVWNDPRFSSTAEPRGTRWQGFFGHLFSYGAVYYSYLFDRAIAGRIWTDVFDGNKSDGIFGKSTPRALDRAQGQLYRDEVLKWGGSRDPWHCVAGVLGAERAWMADGGEKAMREVGKWGAGEAGDAGSFM